MTFCNHNNSFYLREFLHGHTGKQASRQAGKQAGKQGSKQAERQRGREAGRRDRKSCVLDDNIASGSGSAGGWL